jgi:peptidoglycan/LPS O-acetylase OafA/YrhL
MGIGIIGYCLFEFDKTGILSYSYKYALFFSFGVVLGRHYDSAKNYFRLIPALILLAVDWMIACPILNIPVVYGVTGIIGFYGVFSVGVHIEEKNTRIKQALDYLGKNSYGIYLLSYSGQIPLRIVLYSKMHMPYWVCVGAMFIGGMVLPVIGMWIIRKNRLLRVIALGEK